MNGGSSFAHRSFGLTRWWERRACIPVSPARAKFVSRGVGVASSSRTATRTRPTSSWPCVRCGSVPASSWITDLRAAGVQPPVAVGGCPPPAPPKREGVGAEAPPVQGGTVPEEKPGGEEKTAVSKEEKKKRFRKKKRPRPNQRRPARRKQEKPVQRKIRVGKTGPEEEKGRERSEAEAGVAGGEVVSQSDPARKWGDQHLLKEKLRRKKQPASPRRRTPSWRTDQSDPLVFGGCARFLGPLLPHHCLLGPEVVNDRQSPLDHHHTGNSTSPIQPPRPQSQKTEERSDGSEPVTSTSTGLA